VLCELILFPHLSGTWRGRLFDGAAPWPAASRVGFGSRELFDNSGVGTHAEEVCVVVASLKRRSRRQ